jgi:hypothetical protein
VVVAVGQSLQQHERDEEQRNDEMDSVHESKGERSITESYSLRRFFLRQQPPQPLRLEDDERNTHAERLKHSTPEQSLSFASDVEAGCLQYHASKNQQDGTGNERGRKQKSVSGRNERADPNHHPRAADRDSQSHRREQKETEGEIAPALQESIESHFQLTHPHDEISKS